MGVPQSFQKIIVKPLWLLQYCSAYPVAVAFSSYLFGKHQVEKGVESWEELFKRTYVEKCSKEIGSLSSEFCRIFAQVLLRNARPSPHVALHEAGFFVAQFEYFVYPGAQIAKLHDFHGIWRIYTPDQENKSKSFHASTASNEKDLLWIQSPSENGAWDLNTFQKR